jgi:hypothetical protein
MGFFYLTYVGEYRQKLTVIYTFDRYLPVVGHPPNILKSRPLCSTRETWPSLVLVRLPMASLGACWPVQVPDRT